MVAIRIHMNKHADREHADREHADRETEVFVFTLRN